MKKKPVNVMKSINRIIATRVVQCFSKHSKPTIEEIKRIITQAIESLENAGIHTVCGDDDEEDSFYNDILSTICYACDEKAILALVLRRMKNI